jgi:hypothetical protein
MAEYVFVQQGNGPATGKEAKLLVKYLEGHSFHDPIAEQLDTLIGLCYEKKEQGPKIERKRMIHSLNGIPHVSWIIRATLGLNMTSPTENLRAEECLVVTKEFIKRYNLSYGQNINCEVNPELRLSHGTAEVYFNIFNRALNSARSDANNIELKAEETQLTPEQLRYLGPNQGIYTIDDAFVRFSVIDDGEGIPEEDLPKIYQAGYSASGSTGISLALTDLVCRTLHGFERVESVVGEGTTFELYVPKERKERAVPRQLKLPF